MPRIHLHVPQMAEDGSAASMGERLLWLAVIERGLTDLSNPIRCGSSPSKSFLRSKASAWFFHPNDDFNEVCNHAQLDPVVVRQIARTRIPLTDTKH